MAKVMRSSRRRVVGASFSLTLVLAMGAAACGSGDEGPALSEAGARGRSVSLAKGCAGCHGADGQGGVGPGWQGLAGSDVTLIDGSTIVADDAYLVRSIVEPGADLLEGFPLQMPRNGLSESEVADIVAYIKDLSAPGDATESEG